MAVYYPPTGFHFNVRLDLDGISDSDFRFKEVSGISMELEEETLVEGGQNGFIHKMPVRARYPDLVLKRGLLLDSVIWDWCEAAIQNMDINPTTAWVSILNEEHTPLQSYTFVNAWPKKWNVSDLNAESGAVVIETLELAYQYYTVD